MNNFHIFWLFHRFQKSRRSFSYFNFLYSQIWLKKRHTSLFPGICREILTKFHQKFVEKIAKFDAETEKKSEIQGKLIELKEPIEFRSNAVPVCLPEETGGDFLGKMATVVGWGRLTEFGESSTNLQKVQVKIIKVENI